MTDRERWELELERATKARDSIFREMAKQYATLSYNDCARYESMMAQQAKRIATAKGQLTRLKNGRVF